MSTLRTLRAHCMCTQALLCLVHVSFTFPGPLWFKAGNKKLLLASRRSNALRRRKTAGNIADGLRCSPWRRAESPGKMTHCLSGGGKNNAGGYIALVHPAKLRTRQPAYLDQHKLLAFLGKKICHFIHDFHPDWIARLGLPVSNGQHDQLFPHMQDRILRRIQAFQSQSKRGAIILFSILSIGHADFLGEQFVYCKPFKTIHGETRMDCVFFIPPKPFYNTSGRRCFRDFDLSLDNVWYGHVVLLFKMTVRTDTNELLDVECAMIDVLFDYAEGRYKFSKM